ncbi:hypothetical protein QQP08_014487 [Theobroma cacao]|nr:hypothetical protein QQP08_014487 [Theobroma cacao]
MMEGGGCGSDPWILFDSRKCGNSDKLHEANPKRLNFGLVALMLTLLSSDKLLPESWSSIKKFKILKLED